MHVTVRIIRLPRAVAFILPADNFGASRALERPSRRSGQRRLEIA
jgi:hypothetical protein